MIRKSSRSSPLPRNRIQYPWRISKPSSFTDDSSFSLCKRDQAIARYFFSPPDFCCGVRRGYAWLSLGKFLLRNSFSVTFRLFDPDVCWIFVDLLQEGFRVQWMIVRSLEWWSSYGFLPSTATAFSKWIGSWCLYRFFALEFYLGDG